MGHIPEPARSTIIVSTIILFIAWIAVALRFYVRWITKVGIASDDWWILVGILLAFITGTTYLYGTVFFFDIDSPWNSKTDPSQAL